LLISYGLPLVLDVKIDARTKPKWCYLRLICWKAQLKVIQRPTKGRGSDASGPNEKVTTSIPGPFTQELLLAGAEPVQAPPAAYFHKAVEVS
jgi:hypothetical protein